MKPPFSNNIFAQIPEQLPEELFECIVKQDNIVIERVILLQGKATLLFEKDKNLISLAPGDYLLIPAHTRHRVEWTQPDFNTVWLAIHL
jgi:cupin 2 domain-containing protein